MGRSKEQLESYEEEQDRGWLESRGLERDDDGKFVSSYDKEMERLMDKDD